MATEILVGWAPILTGVELKTGTKGVFKVLVDGDPVFDKADTGRMPKAGEVRSLLEERLGAPLRWRQEAH